MRSRWGAGLAIAAALLVGCGSSTRAKTTTPAQSTIRTQPTLAEHERLVKETLYKELERLKGKTTGP
jgi:uncharacterized lipoprotein YbaY